MSGHEERGRVVLVGAGPGDPGLLTRRGAEALALADVVVTDRLVDPRTLSLAKAGALIVDAGKAPGRHALSQEAINAALVEHASRGAFVVRLKGGDPFVYGRGMEEAEACRAAGVPVEVVPGVTSALSAPALAGVSVTERGVARTLAIATPAVGEGEALGDDEIAALARMDSVCLLMARGSLGETTARLIAAGRSPETPVAVVQDASGRSQRVVTGTLATISARADEAGVRPPVVATIGATAARARDGAWDLAERAGPLAGRSVVVTRPVSAGWRLGARLAALGAEVIEAPMIRIEYLDPPAPEGDARGWLGSFAWVVFTSLHGVRGFGRWLEARGLDTRALAGSRVAAVGVKTADELRSIGVRADLVPTEHRAAALVSALAERLATDDRALFPCGTLALDEVPEGLGAAGARVTRLRVYDTLGERLTSAARRRIEAGVDAVALYSPTAARALADEQLDWGGATIGAIGPTTASACAEAGLRVDLVPEDYSDEGMTDALVRALGGRAARTEEALA